MQRLVDVCDPMSKKRERHRPLLVREPGAGKPGQVFRDRGEHANGSRAARVGVDLLSVPWDIQIVLFGSRPWVIGVSARFRECDRAAIDIGVHDCVELRPRRSRQLLIRDLARKFVAYISPPESG
jgi:hypothetical protein